MAGVGHEKHECPLGDDRREPLAEFVVEDGVFDVCPRTLPPADIAGEVRLVQPIGFKVDLGIVILIGFLTAVAAEVNEHVVPGR